jgi:hypothetical protein
VAERGPPVAPWRRSIGLSRFRDGVEFPSSSTHPIADIVWQTHCEVDDDTVRERGRIVLSRDGLLLAI